MARKPKGISDMADIETGTAAGSAKKTRKPQGPRKPSPLYAFVKIDAENKVGLAASFRDPRKMAEYFPTATANGESLLIISPEA